MTAEDSTGDGIGGGPADGTGPPPPADPWAPPVPAAAPAPPPAPPFVPTTYTPDPYGGPAAAPDPFAAWHAVQPPAPQAPYNGFAVVSLVTALTCFLWPLGIGFGITGLVQIPRRRERGTGLAVAGLVLSLLGLLTTVAVVVLPHRGVLQGLAANGTAPSKLTPGQCFDRGSKGVSVLSCDRAHDGEAIGTTQLTGDDYPDQPGREQQVAEACGQLANDYAMDNWAVSDAVVVHYYYPQRDAWAGGDRTVSCFLTDPDTQLTGSLRRDSSNTTPAQYEYLLSMDAIDQAAGKRPSGGPAEAPADFRSWAAAMARVLDTQTAVLSRDAWDPGVKEAVAAQVAELQLRIPALKAAAASAGTDDLTAQLAQADRHRAYDQQKAVRKLLNLSTDDSWLYPSMPADGATQSV
ncbi:hypothetical protein P3T37_004429 [Kitasatospora sp. MAA4]|uniref:DUF4190 domain-containing protein n=1 Tax=Kitasatospora sp. MAA4 TaxID=3035093 RepID=UPI0024734370|nr:DUF4190 domain-containing protein [Kitasatospora sp. MAA4]MDH6135019.1 hypothetical protein [Kitasatospora sp. MAA4]